MSRDWNLIAKGIAPDIPQPELENVIGVLKALEEQFTPLRQTLPHETEPSLIFPSFHAPEESA
jgi:hypothetical protein